MPVNATSDVRRNIPFTSMTDPSFFPSYEHQEYPKMMLKKDGKPFIGIDEKPVLVNNEDEEAAFRDENETLVIVNDRQLNSAERAELEELRALRNGKTGDATDPRQPGPETRPNPLGALTARPDRPNLKKPGQQLKDRGGAPLPKPIKSGNK